MLTKIINFLTGKTKKDAESDKWLFGTILGFGTTGMIASFVLTLEEFHLLKDPNATLSCSFNLVLNCATVMKTEQASAFGFPNMFIGLVGFAVVITIGLLGLSKVKFPKWFLVGQQIGITLMTVFAYWLFLSSIYVIQVLCPWCLIVTFSMTMLFAATTRYNLRENTFGLQKTTHKKVLSFLAKDYDKVIVAGWIVLDVALVFAKFGESLFA